MDGQTTETTGQVAAPTGMLKGGWEYVWSAYAITFTMVLGYGLLTTLWYRRALSRKEMA